MADKKDVWFVPEGVYGEGERADFHPSIRKPTVLEQRRLSQQPEFVYFVPYLPLAACADAPDVAAEYCLAKQTDVRFVCWEVDSPLFPKLSAVGIDTRYIFGVEKKVGDDLLDFASGIILQDEGQKLVFRLVVQKLKILEPGVSLARPQEKILADLFEVNIFCVQTADALLHAEVAEPPTRFKIKYNKKGGDPGLCQVAKNFWTRESGTRILDR
jgi:hypothetical protein